MLEVKCWNLQLLDGPGLECKSVLESFPNLINASCLILLSLLWMCSIWLHVWFCEAFTCDLKHSLTAETMKQVCSHRQILLDDKKEFHVEQKSSCQSLGAASEKTKAVRTAVHITQGAQKRQSCIKKQIILQDSLTARLSWSGSFQYFCVHIKSIFFQTCLWLEHKPWRVWFCSQATLNVSDWFSVRLDFQHSSICPFTSTKTNVWFVRWWELLPTERSIFLFWRDSEFRAGYRLIFKAFCQMKNKPTACFGKAYLFSQNFLSGGNTQLRGTWWPPLGRWQWCCWGGWWL